MSTRGWVEAMKKKNIHVRERRSGEEWMGKGEAAMARQRRGARQQPALRVIPVSREATEEGGGERKERETAGAGRQAEVCPSLVVSPVVGTAKGKHRRTYPVFIAKAPQLRRRRFLQAERGGARRAPLAEQREGGARERGERGRLGVHDVCSSSASARGSERREGGREGELRARAPHASVYSAHVWRERHKEGWGSEGHAWRENKVRGWSTGSPPPSSSSSSSFSLLLFPFHPAHYASNVRKKIRHSMLWL